MSDYREAQALEVEGLRCLYTHGELTEPAADTVQLRLVPYAESLDDKEKNLVEVSLWIHFTEMYPSELPDYKLVNVRGLNQRQVKEIEGLIKTEMNDLIGSDMIYGVADSIQTWLRQNNRRTLSMHDEMMAKSTGPVDNIEDSPTSDEGEKDDENSGDYKGLAEKDLCKAVDRLTKAVFEDWKEAFRKEMEETGVWQKKRGAANVTGKLFFQQQASPDVLKAGQAEFVCENEDAFLEVDDADLEFGDDDQELDD